MLLLLRNFCTESSADSLQQHWLGICLSSRASFEHGHDSTFAVTTTPESHLLSCPATYSGLLPRDSTSEYIRNLKLSARGVLYVATNRGIVHRVQLPGAPIPLCSKRAAAAEVSSFQAMSVQPSRSAGDAAHIFGCYIALCSILETTMAVYDRVSTRRLFGDLCHKFCGSWQKFVPNLQIII